MACNELLSLPFSRTDSGVIGIDLGAEDEERNARKIGL